MAWARWLAVVLCAVQGGYMVFDGVRALVVGSYITPRSGEHAGQLGPWARIVRAVGIDPESTAMKAAFVVLGAAYLVASAAWAAGAGWARWLGARPRRRHALVPRPRDDDQRGRTRPAPDRLSDTVPDAVDGRSAAAQPGQMTTVVRFPEQRARWAWDARGDNRAVRVSAHQREHLVNLSVWRDDLCVGTVRLRPDEAAALVTGLTDGLAQLAARPTGSSPSVDHLEERLDASRGAARGTGLAHRRHTGHPLGTGCASRATSRSRPVRP